MLMERKPPGKYCRGRMERMDPQTRMGLERISQTASASATDPIHQECLLAGEMKRAFNQKNRGLFGKHFSM